LLCALFGQGGTKPHFSYPTPPHPPFNKIKKQAIFKFGYVEKKYYLCAHHLKTRTNTMVSLLLHTAFSLDFHYKIWGNEALLPALIFVKKMGGG
jgi:hypothetical protein